MGDIWEAAKAGDVGEVERHVGQDPGLLNAGDRLSWTPLMWASREGHVGVVRWLSNNGAAINEHDDHVCTACYKACSSGHAPVVKLLVEMGADPTIVMDLRTTPLMIASDRGHLEVVRFLLDHPSAKATLNNRDHAGRTALSVAC
jgi:ankyrin repeat protein